MIPGGPVGGSTVELATYGRFVRRHRLASFLLGLLGLGLGLGVTQAAPSTYQATADVFAPATPAYLALDVRPYPDTDAYEPREWTQDTEAALVRSEVVLARVVRRLGGDSTTTELADRIRISVPTSTRVFSLSVTAGTREGARDAARILAEEFLARRNTLLADRAERVSVALRDRRASLQGLLTDAPTESELSADDPRSGLPVNQALRGQLRAQIARIDEALVRAAGTSANQAEIVKPPILPLEAQRNNAEVAPVSGLLAGLLGGLALGHHRDRRRRVVVDADDVTDATGLPVLAQLDGSHTLATGESEPELDRLATRVRLTLDPEADPDAAPATPLLPRGQGPRVLVTGCCEEALAVSVADRLGVALTAPAAARLRESATGARGLVAAGVDAFATVDIGRVMEVVAYDRPGSASMLRRARHVDIVLLLADLEHSSRRDLARTSRLLATAGVPVAAVTVQTTGGGTASDDRSDSTRTRRTTGTARTSGEAPRGGPGGERA